MLYNTLHASKIESTIEKLFKSLKLKVEILYWTVCSISYYIVFRYTLSKVFTSMT